MRNLRDVKKELQVPVYSSGGVELRAERMGSVFYKDFKLSQVGLIPAMPFNVVSIGQLATQGLLINTGDGRFTITAVDEAKVVGEGFLHRRKEKEDGREYYECVFRTMDWDIPGDELIDPSEDHENESAVEGEEWIIDTGCAQHMVPDLGTLSKPRAAKLPFQSASSTIWSSHKGLVKIGQLMLKDVLCCPGVTDNLVSGPMLDISGHMISFNSKRCTKKDCKKKGPGQWTRGLGYTS
uniref:Uncharacterized protein n=1 Tax=Arundo donax TaxID=35708 RepID=A0A0A9GR34_ARUDO